MNLFERLLHRRLCNEQPGDGGAAPAASEPSPTPAPTEPAQEPAAEAPPAETDKPEPSGDKPEQGSDKDKKPETQAPEKYEFTAPEGTELDSKAVELFEPVARELNLTNEQAQKLVDVYPKILSGVQQRQAEAWQKQTEGWAESVKTDKEVGGDKLTANLGAAQRALDQFGTPELREYLDGTGLGNHPELVKAFIKVGKAMSEDGVLTGKESGERSAAEVLYGK
ncbi:TPA: peptidase [Raoultella ornithinolytica]|nr:peptidase [Raoultella ornithinolytica]HDT5909870.1 peptidase [Raoultella ornithinolytica]HDT5917585.1 peptidase [Raoultella ornithinolytica]HDT5965649.1 peptidase [Raoultella ornithinolytica]HDT6008237.1 peptidase [Raoultella ornithinolytica]